MIITLLLHPVTQFLSFTSYKMRLIACEFYVCFTSVLPVHSLTD